MLAPKRPKKWVTVALNATTTRQSLVKGERLVRDVVTAAMRQWGRANDASLIFPQDSGKGPMRGSNPNEYQLLQVVIELHEILFYYTYKFCMLMNLQNFCY